MRTEGLKQGMGDQKKAPVLVVPELSGGLKSAWICRNDDQECAPGLGGCQRGLALFPPPQLVQPDRVLKATQ